MSDDATRVNNKGDRSQQRLIRTSMIKIVTEIGGILVNASVLTSMNTLASTLQVPIEDLWR